MDKFSDRSVLRTRHVGSWCEVDVPCQSKVSNLHSSSVVDKYVASCEIAMNEATLLQVLHTFSHLASVTHTTTIYLPVVAIKHTRQQSRRELLCEIFTFSSFLHYNNVCKLLLLLLLLLLVHGV